MKYRMSLWQRNNISLVPSSNTYIHYVFKYYILYLQAFINVKGITQYAFMYVDEKWKIGNKLEEIETAAWGRYQLINNLQYMFT